VAAVVKGTGTAVAFTDGAHRQRDPDALPDSSDPSGRCPWCNRVSNFTRQTSFPLYPRGDSNGASDVLQRVSVLQCHGCSKGVVVVEDTYWGETRHEGSGAASFRGFHWWPIPGGAPLSTDVPSSVSDAFGEASRCLSAHAPNGAVAMLRTALTWIVEDKGSETAKGKADLKDKIKAMVTEGGLPTALGEWADHVRLYGNAGVHPDKFGDVSQEEAEDVARLAYSLIEALYILPANIAKRQAERRR
jgi:hypothetical protein